MEIKKLSPIEIKTKEFKRVAWGYSPKEVVEFLDETAKTWEKVIRHEREMLEKVQLMSEELARWKGREVELEKIKERAMGEAHAIREQAQKECEKIFENLEVKAADVRGRTEEWLADVIAKVEELQRQKSNFMTAFRSALDSHYELLKKEQVEEESIGQRLSEFLKGRDLHSHN